MPARCERKGQNKAVLAARLYLMSIRDGDAITLEAASERYAVSRGAIKNALVALRRGQP